MPETHAKTAEFIGSNGKTYRMTARYWGGALLHVHLDVKVTIPGLELDVWDEVASWAPGEEDTEKETGNV